MKSETHAGDYPLYFDFFFSDSSKSAFIDTSKISILVLLRGSAALIQILNDNKHHFHLNNIVKTKH